MTPSAGSGDPEAGYRPISGLAVAAVLVGCLSALAVAGPAFWVVPLLGTALAMLALGDVSREGRPKAGRLAALAGLALSIGFGMQGLTSSIVSNWVSARRAASAVDMFVEAVRAGRLGEARSMCAPAALPPPLSDRQPADPSGAGGQGPDRDGHDHPGHEPAGQDRLDADIEAFAAMPAIARLVACGAGGPSILTPAEDDGPELAAGGAYRFLVEVPGRSGPPARISVSVGRETGGGRFDRWVVVRHSVEPG